MYQIIGVTELQRRFRILFDSVARNKTTIVLTRGSRPEAALIPYDEFEKYQTFTENRILAQFDDLLKRMEERSKDLGDDEVLDDVRSIRDEA